MGGRETQLHNQSCCKIEDFGRMALRGAALLAVLGGVAHAASSSATAAPVAVSTVSQSIAIVDRDGSRRQFARQVRVSTRQTVKATSSSKPEKAAPASRILSQTVPGRLKPNVVPGYPNATINSQSFGTTAVGGTSSTIILSYPYPAGVTSQELTFAAGLNGFFGQATCNYPQPCTAPIAFQPTYPGLTTNAVISK